MSEHYKIAPRQTWCNACEMWHRSRLEADTHMAFDRAGVAAIYEPCSYTVMGFKKGYLPDFALYPFVLRADERATAFLPSLIEVKPTWEIAYSFLETGKYQAFACDADAPVLVMVPGGHLHPPTFIQDFPFRIEGENIDRFFSLPFTDVRANALLLSRRGRDGILPLLVRPAPESGVVVGEIDRCCRELSPAFWDSWA